MLHLLDNIINSQNNLCQYYSKLGITGLFVIDTFTVGPSYIIRKK